MNPVVLIATHNRIEITSRCIESLMMQSVQPKIVLVVSDQGEWQYYKKKFPDEKYLKMSALGFYYWYKVWKNKIG